MLKSSSICVIDIGGTNYRCGLFINNELSIIERKKTPNFLVFSDENQIKKELVNDILSSYEKAQKLDKDIKDLAICFPGPVSSGGKVIGSSVIFGDTLVEEFNLKAELSMHLHNVNIFITNDITAAAWRYSKLYDTFCLITVSSGIGNKVFSNGRVMIDDKGITGELGHYEAAIDADISIPCTCGWGKNHIGMISSGRGIELFAKKFASVESEYRNFFLSSSLSELVNAEEEKITAKHIVTCAQRNDPFSTMVIDYCTKPLADAICLLALAAYIPKFIIIGGFALNCDYYLEALRNNIYKRGIYNFSQKDIEAMLVYGHKDDDHGLIGLGMMVNNSK